MTDYNPYDVEVRQDPYPHFAQFHQSCPVHHHVLSEAEREIITGNPMVARPTSEFWQVFSYAGACEVLQNHEVFSSLQGSGPERAISPTEGGMLINADPPHHSRHRQILAQALNPRAVNALEPRVREIADELLDRFADSGEGDLVGLFTSHYPGLVFAEILGVDPADQDNFERWAVDIVDAFGGNPEMLQRSVASIMELAVYFMTLVKNRREAAERGEELPKDLLTALMTEECDGRPFNDEELLYVFPILVVGGNETTASALANALYELCSHPDQLELLYKDPSLIPLACEEVVRFQTTPQVQFRTANVDTMVEGVKIPADAKIGVVYGAANRDERAFTNAGEFDITRDTKELRQHLGFGRGIHACIGASLGRLLMRVGMEQMLARLPELRFDGSKPAPERHLSLIVRSWESLPLRWTPAN